ncbi:MAG: chlorite dismutase family protein [Acidimicrobiales bacterium]
MTEPLQVTVGLNVLHLFGTLTPGFQRQLLIAACEKVVADGGLLVPAAILGHKADLGLMALHPDAVVLRRLQTEVRLAGLELVDSYVSVTEVSEYADAAGVPEAMRQMRLYPKRLPPPGKRAFCFYPMSKRRDPGVNWFKQDFDTRRSMMEEHGHSGRAFGERISQLITASTGLDDYEWAVTLFANHPDDLKAVVYTMRFDQASAEYGIFGRFITGISGSLDEVLELLGC